MSSPNDDEGKHPNAGAFMRLPVGERPTTAAMMTALDEKLGGRSVVMACLREKALESRRIGFPVSALWEEYCYEEVKPPAPEPNAVPRDDKEPAPIASSADAIESRPPELPLRPESRSRLDPEGAAPQNALFDAGELPEAKAREEHAQTIYVHFEDLADIPAFAKLVGQPVTSRTKFLRFPPTGDFSAAWRARVEAEEAAEEKDDDDGLDDGDRQPNLFGYGEWWEEHWRGMPEFDQKNLAPKHSIKVFFATRADVEAFSKLVGQTITEHARRTRSVWFPEAEIGRFADKSYVSGSPLNPRYPVYIISKGRWDTRLTAKSLEKLRVPYRIVVEPQERDAYAAVIDPAKILVLPFSNLGLGSIPARNWVWEHAKAEGADRHWILDDNIDGFYRLNRNLKTPVADGTIFRCAEDFVDRYENVAIAGFHYFMFASRKTKMPPFTLNSRVYSMILIRNDLRLGVDGVGQWRGRYNEDTDLSLRALKDGWATVLFLSFLGMKSTTMSMKGGNTDELYAGTNKGPKENDGRWKMAQSLVEQHPDVTRVTWKWGRWQHHVDYSGFRKTKLILRPDVEIRDGVDDYGMSLYVDPNYQTKGKKGAV